MLYQSTEQQRPTLAQGAYSINNYPIKNSKKNLLFPICQYTTDLLMLQSIGTVSVLTSRFLLLM